jgi:hypothetical protein
MNRVGNDAGSVEALNNRSGNGKADTEPLECVASHGV